MADRAARGAGETLPQMRAFVRQRVEQVVPPSTDGAQACRGQQHAQDGPIRLHELQAGIAAGEQDQLDMVAQRRDLRCARAA